MVLPIVQYGDPVLRKKCTPVTETTDEIRTLVQDMIETMEDAQGVGLAAPQIGQDIQLAIVDVSHDPESVSYLKVNGEDVPLTELSQYMPLVFLNPELELMSPNEMVQEGCLSIYDVRAKVMRPSQVKARLTQLDRTVLEIETDGLLARAIQHEVDHLHGILFVDRLTTVGRTRVAGQLKRLLKRQY